MAGDWIKLEHATVDKPEVYRMAETLSVPPEQVLGCLIRVWVWADQQIATGNAVSVTEKTIDCISRVTDFAAAMRSVGWLECTDGGCEFPNFERHNGKTAKNRALTARRVAKSKEGKRSGNAAGNGSVTVGALPREEKRREEKKTSSPPPNTTSSAVIQPEGGGGGEGAWSELEQRLAVLGMTDVSGMRRRCQLNCVEAEQVIDFWQRVGQWPLAALHWRLANGVPGVLSSEGWPPPGGGPAQALDCEANRQRQTRESLACRIVRDGRRNKLDEQAIRAELKQQGLGWPGEGT